MGALPVAEEATRASGRGRQMTQLLASKEYAGHRNRERWIKSDEGWRAVWVCYIVPTVRLSPAFLISQKSKIFDSFPPGEAKAACGGNHPN